MPHTTPKQRFLADSLNFFKPKQHNTKLLKIQQIPVSNLNTPAAT